MIHVVPEAREVVGHLDSAMVGRRTSNFTDKAHLAPSPELEPRKPGRVMSRA